MRELCQRIETGTATVRDAAQVQAMGRRLIEYGRALAAIARGDEPRAAALAKAVLMGTGKGQEASHGGLE